MPEHCVERDMAKIRALVRLIAREHEVSPLEDCGDYAGLLSFLRDLDEDPASFFAVVFAPWEDVDLEELRSTLPLIRDLPAALDRLRRVVTPPAAVEDAVTAESRVEDRQH